jgi:hypothetical protein
VTYWVTTAVAQLRRAWTSVDGGGACFRHFTHIGST